MKKNLFILLLSCVLFSNCKDYYCAGFPQKDKAWFPYEKGESIKLYSQLDSINLPISEIYITKPYSEDYFCDCHVCDAIFTCKTKIDTSNLISLQGSLLHDDGNKITELPKFEINITIYEKKDNLLIPLYDDIFTSNYTFHDSILISNTKYYDVLSFLNDRNKRFKTLRIAKGIGLIELEDIESHIWSRF